jgi:hypothetical protein
VQRNRRRPELRHLKKFRTGLSQCFRNYSRASHDLQRNKHCIIRAGVQNRSTAYTKPHAHTPPRRGPLNTRNLGWLAKQAQTEQYQQNQQAEQTEQRAQQCHQNQQ